MFAQLGNIVFEGLKGFTDFNNEGTTKFAEHALIFGKPTLQRVGSELSSIEVSIRLHASFCVPSDELSALYDSRENGEIMPLVWGNSVYGGDYVIEKMKTNLIQTDGEGNVFEAECSLTLKEFIEPDPLGSKKTNAKKGAFALNNKSITKSLINNGLPSNQNNVMSSIKNAQQATSKVQKAANDLNDNINKAQELSKRINDNFKKAESAFQSVKDVLNQADTLKARAMSLYNSAVNGLVIIRNLKTRVPFHSGADAIAAADALKGATKDLNSGGAVIAGILAMQRVIH